MTKQIREFTYFECNGPSPTPFRDQCPAESPGGWTHPDAESNAAGAGWVTKGRSHFCPQHKDLAT